jgi:hypothetical protein
MLPTQDGGASSWALSLARAAGPTRPCALHEPCVRRARDVGDVRWCSLFTKMDPGGEGAIAHGQ